MLECVLILGSQIQNATTEALADHGEDDKNAYWIERESERRDHLGLGDGAVVFVFVMESVS
jgi:hypothetical protein